jgi:hypothetical protein
MTPIGRTLRESLRGSALVQSLTRLIASVRVRPEALPQDVIDDDLAAVRGLFGGSVLATRIRGWLGGVVGAARGSQTLGVSAGWTRQIAAVEWWQWIRAAGIAGLTAAAVAAMSTLFDPRPASGYRWWLWAVAVAVSATGVLGARALDAARGSSQIVRRL